MKDKPTKGKAPRGSRGATPGPHAPLLSDMAELVITTQQSRFHVDLEPPVSSDNAIDIKYLTLSLGDRELLAHAQLKLKAGRRYVLVGRNGSGKSTLLKALAEGRVPGVSWEVRVVLLGQTEEVVSAEGVTEAGGAVVGETVLEHVIRSDRQRGRALEEVEVLSAALNDEENPLAAVRALRQVEDKRLHRQLLEKQEIAKRRSGARGLRARQDLIACEKEVEASQERLSHGDSDISPETIESETQKAAGLLAEVQSALEAMDSPTALPRALTLLHGLGFPTPETTLYTSLSGGWRTRATLASCLFTPAHVLLLDEPTNFLDLPALIWLENYLCSSAFESTQTTCVVVTHDRAFADAVAEELLVLREQKLEVFKGGPTEYDRERRRQIRRMGRMKELQEKKNKDLEAQIAGNVKAAKRTGDDKKLKQAASRRKKLEDRSGLEVGKSGGRFKLNRDLEGYHLSKRADIEVPKGEAAARIGFSSVPEPLKFPGALVSVEGVMFGYGKKETVLRDVTVVIHPGERVGIVGLNGAGKSTLVKLMVGNEDTGESLAARAGYTPHLKPVKGVVTRHSRARIGWFSQHAVDELNTKGLKDRERTALVELMEAADGGLREGEARGLLAGLGLQGGTAGEVPLFALSGGQKVRVAIAKLVWSTPHMLVLDEVTTHLDAESILALIDALDAYEGALLVVTHDRFFMRSVVEGEDMMDDEDDDGSSSEDGCRGKGRKVERKPGVIYRVVNGQVKRLEGGMREYEDIVMKSLAKGGKWPR